ncbi:MAG: (2Fe-2S) ferredoxin domain-containing protein [Planctomycetes bacterium]|nr:(2Fe-2S) ferredoxin domain-containing protein [Planctomycetota bacterium]MCA8936720.1 (2Fe-2S) ferredoxin domain-containing protein [Planctomycetota bacterium]MCA8947259.1 (2Fe-2S) ferredoxin domain-containing protein [Planctomycetota bacterium]
MAKEFPPYERHVFICMNERESGHPRGDCKSKGAEGVLLRFKELVAQKKLKPRIRAQKSGCLDTCELGVSVVVYPEAVWYKQVSPADVDEIVESHLVNGVPVERLRAFPTTPGDSAKLSPIGNA